VSDYRHATALVIGEKGLLLLGAAGAGKSALAERLIAEARARGHFARLVGDDRIGLRVERGRLIASCHPVIRGQVERRGIGISAVNYVEKAVLSGVVALESAPARLPEPAALMIEIHGVGLPRLTLRDDRDLAAKAHLVLDWLGR